ncbi:MAG: arginase family protein [Chitinophagaceae bacterium]|nr:arginase family protein [Chitinophagaceae bacterium]
MSAIQEIQHYTMPVTFMDSEDTVYLPSQLGSNIRILTENNMDIDALDLIILGCGELRGQDFRSSYSSGPDEIRRELYQLHYWHQQVRIGDLGNIIEGASVNDTRAALRSVLAELHQMGKKVLILGGSHDLTLQQYQVFRELDEIVDLTVVDMLADLNQESDNRYDNYLMEALVETPNYVRHFNLIGFQSYYVNPLLIETFDKLRFDCVRVGRARENIDLLEPYFRNTHIGSIDINAIRYSDAPANRLASPNGFYGDEMCKITRFAGMSTHMKSLGIYGYQPEMDSHGITAKLLAQMIWYYIDGLQVQKTESPLEERDQFFEYHITFTDNNALFLKSKKTNRWWMQLPDESFMPCSHQDYISACNNEIPERWMRELERLV